MNRPSLPECPESIAYRVLCEQMRACPAFRGWALLLGETGTDPTYLREWSSDMTPGVRFTPTGGDAAIRYAEAYEWPIWVEVEIAIRTGFVLDHLRAWHQIKLAYYPADPATRLAFQEARRDRARIRTPLTFSRLAYETIEGSGLTIARGQISGVLYSPLHV